MNKDTWQKFYVITTEKNHSSNYKKLHKKETVESNFTEHFQTWKILSPMPLIIQWFGCTALPKDSNKFIVAGSWVPNENRDKCHIYDASTDTWTPAANLQIGRQGTSLVIFFYTFCNHII